MNYVLIALGFLGPDPSPKVAIMERHPTIELCEAAREAKRSVETDTAIGRARVVTYCVPERFVRFPK